MLSKDPPDLFQRDKARPQNLWVSSSPTRFCPSFVELFENSLVLKSPADIEIFYEFFRLYRVMILSHYRLVHYMNQREFVSFNNHNLFKDISIFAQKYINFK